jgi:hypothetical protein
MGGSFLLLILIERVWVFIREIPLVVIQVSGGVSGVEFWVVALGRDADGVFDTLGI